MSKIDFLKTEIFLAIIDFEKICRIPEEQSREVDVRMFKKESYL